MTYSPVVVIGTGFGGIAMAIKLKKAGIPFTVLERGERVGGVWSANTYPGAACDIPSHLYSLSFEHNANWSRKYSRQAEIQQYLEHCARKYGCLEHIRFGQEVERADFDQTAGRWSIKLKQGDVLESQFLVSAAGQLSQPVYPRMPGLPSFTGKVFHSAHWDHSYDLTGKRVAVAGTGASAIQFVPEIAPKVAQLSLFQRSAPYVLPKADRPYTRLEIISYRLFPWLLDLSRARQYAYHEARVLILTQGHFLGLAHRIWEHAFRLQVKDERLRRLLTPDYPIGCKRVLLSNDWYPALTRPNVEVIPHQLSAVDGNLVRTASGIEREVDAIIFGTGFAANEFLAPMIITGPEGIELHEVWRGRGGAEAYLGITVSGFPNLFLMYGPNTNLGHNSIVYMLESQADYVLGAIQYAERRGLRCLQVQPAVEEEYNRHLARRLQDTVWHSGCESWYISASGKNTNNWPGFTFEYRRRTHHFDPMRYQTA